MTPHARTTPHDDYLIDGFYVADYPVLPREMVNSAAAGMDEIREGRYDRGRPPLDSPWKPGDDPHALCKIEQPQFANRAIFAAVSYADLGALAARVTGARMVQVWWVQLLCKPSSSDGETDTRIGWHQDHDYWAAWKRESSLFTVWLALSDVDADCGPMRFLRASHRWGHQEGLSDFYGQDLDRQRRAIRDLGHVWDEVPALLPAGGVSFHDQLVFHGSGANLSGRPRCSLAIHMRTERSWPDSDRSHTHTSFLDQPELCPVVFGSL